MTRFLNFFVNLRRMNFIKYTIILLLFIGFSACVKDTIVDKTPIQPKTNQIQLLFKPFANSKDFVAKSKWYTNPSNEVFNVTKFNYYISNIQLTDLNGKVFKEPESYHLIKHADNVNDLMIKDVPFGEYNKIEFLIGVDSARNVSGAQTGALDPANVMFWEWNSGYIFFKLEGSYASATTNEMEYAMHVGGFSGKFSCLQNASFTMNSFVSVKADKISKIYMNVILDEIFKTPNKLNFDQYYLHIGDSMFNLISKNYKNMFVFDKIEN